MIGVEGERSYDGVEVPAGFLTGEERVRSTTSCSGVAGSSFVMGSCWNVDVLTSMDGIDVVVLRTIGRQFLLSVSGIQVELRKTHDDSLHIGETQDYVPILPHTTD